jgi:hypothetical protein
VGSFELRVATAGHVQHWWRHNASQGPWVPSATCGADVKRVVALLQGTYWLTLEVVVQRTDDHHQHYCRDGAGWHAAPVVPTP